MIPVCRWCQDADEQHKVVQPSRWSKIPVSRKEHSHKSFYRMSPMLDRVVRAVPEFCCSVGRDCRGSLLKLKWRVPSGKSGAEPLVQAAQIGRMSAMPIPHRLRKPKVHCHRMPRKLPQMVPFRRTR